MLDRVGLVSDRVRLASDRVGVASDDRVGTVYVWLGDIPLTTAFALLLLSMILVKYKAHYEQRRTLSL